MGRAPLPAGWTLVVTWERTPGGPVPLRGLLCGLRLGLDDTMAVTGSPAGKRSPGLTATISSDGHDCLVTNVELLPDEAIEVWRGAHPLDVLLG